MKKTYIASRLSEGNKIFPPQITIEDAGISIKVPGFFKDKSQFLPYSQIGEVKVNSPLVGFCTISFYASGTYVQAHGFTDNDAKAIRRYIREGTSPSKSRNIERNSFSRDMEDESTVIESLAKAKRITYENERDERTEYSESPWKIKIYDETDVATISFPNDKEKIKRTLEYLIGEAHLRYLKIKNETYSKSGPSWHNETYLSIIGSCIEKVSNGIEMLKLLKTQKAVTDYYKIKLAELKLHYDFAKEKQRKLKLYSAAFHIGLVLVMVVVLCFLWHNIDVKSYNNP